MCGDEALIILNHPKIPAPTLHQVADIDAIASTPPGSVVRFTFDWEMLHYCKANAIAAAVDINSLQEAVFANALEAKFLLCSFKLAKEVQRAAEEYLFDAKVVAKTDCRLIEEVIRAEIDGILCTNYALK